MAIWYKTRSLFQDLFLSHNHLLSLSVDEKDSLHWFSYCSNSQSQTVLQFSGFSQSEKLSAAK